jgi:hypothetical protein
VGQRLQAGGTARWQPGQEPRLAAPRLAAPRLACAASREAHVGKTHRQSRIGRRTRPITGCVDQRKRPLPNRMRPDQIDRLQRPIHRLKRKLCSLGRSVRFSSRRSLYSMGSADPAAARCSAIRADDSKGVVELSYPSEGIAQPEKQTYERPHQYHPCSSSPVERRPRSFDRLM